MADVASARQRVQAILQQLLDSEPAQDEGGNWILPAGSARVIINVVQPQPMVPPMAVVASAILAQVPP